MLVVGLTGGIATGKSTVSNLLQTKHHVVVVDADIIARQVVEPGTATLKKIVTSFGKDVLLPDGTLDRKKLGTIIFNDATKRKQLNGIVHPAVRWEILKQVVWHWITGQAVCVLDVPLLIEGGLWRYVGCVVLVHCKRSPPSTQLSRLISRDDSSPSDAQSRLNSQMPIFDKLPYADIPIDNSGSREQLENATENLVLKLQKRAGWWYRVNWFFPPLGICNALCSLFWRSLRWHIKRKSRED